MITVIKVGGRAQSDPRLVVALAALWRERPGSVVIVHGGGDEVSALQRLAGVEPRFVDGRRVTSAADIDRLRMALSGAANKRLVAALAAVGVDAIGLSGEDGRLLVAGVADGGALGAVGAVRAVRTSLLRHLLDGGYFPVLSPLASADGGAALNVNGDDAAAAVAVALDAAELLFVSDVPTVRLSGVAAVELGLEALRHADVVDGMRAKIRSALHAAGGGVGSVRIGDIDMLSDEGAGTAIVAPASTSAVA